MRRIVILLPLAGLFFVLPCGAEQPTETKAKPVTEDRVEITGSHIKQKVRRMGHNTDGIVPLYVIDRTDIERSGATTLGGVLRQVPFATVSGF